LKAPDAIEPVVGWRAWRVARVGGRLVLLSAVYDEIWEPGRELAASCHKGRDHTAPDPQCTCGIYAAQEVIEASRHRVGRNDPGVLDRVLGEVALWGRVVEGERGWRAAYAYPVRLWVRPGPDAEEILAGLAAYRVPGMLEPEPASTRWPRPLSFAR
jgi:hypothetical protein